ncbi:hypothetical protein G6F46_015371 [Rhizopus delemar]|nr:hypothetical protein G6F46_015371 [Rhizopus delemar]
MVRSSGRAPAAGPTRPHWMCCWPATWPSSATAAAANWPPVAASTIAASHGRLDRTPPSASVYRPAASCSSTMDCAARSSRTCMPRSATSCCAVPTAAGPTSWRWWSTTLRRA